MGDTNKTKRVIRIDAGALRPPVETPQGFLRVDGLVGRCGIYEYMNDDGTIRRELRTPEEVFKAHAMDGYEGAPVTDDHPMEPVTRDNVKKYEAGSATSARRDGDSVAASMVIKDPTLIAKVKSGRKNQLSPGYALDLDMTPGVAKQYAYPGNPEGRYDAIQRNIEINHLAVVDAARGGPNMKLRLDGRDVPVRAYRMDGVEVGTLVLDEELSAEQRNSLRDQSFAYPEQGKLPINDEEHVRAAMSRFSGTDFSANAGAKKRAFGKIVSAAKKHGIDTTNFEQEYGGHLDDMIVVAVDPDGDELAGTENPNDDNYDKRGPMADKQTGMTNEDAIKSLEAQRINLDQKVRTLTEENAALKLRADTAEGRLAEVQKDLVSTRAELVSSKVASETVAVKTERDRADAAEAALAKLNSDRASDIRKRVALERLCAPTLGDAFRMDSLSDRQLMCLVLKRLDAHADTSDSVADGVIIGRFQAAVERRDANASALAQVSVVMDVNKREQERRDRAPKPAWQQPLPNSKYNANG